MADQQGAVMDGPWTDYAPAAPAPSSAAKAPNDGPWSDYAPPKASAAPSPAAPSIAQDNEGTEVPKPIPTGSIQAHEPTFGESARAAIANTAVGHSIEASLPGLADGLNLHPTETVNSPTYEQHKDQLLAPEYLVRHEGGAEAPATPTENRIRGAATAVGGLTSGNSMATMAGTAVAAGATAGIVNPGSAALLSRLVSGGFTLDMLHGLYQQHKAYKQAVDSGNVAEAQKIQGEMGVTGVMALLTAKHALTPHGEMRAAVPEEDGPWNDYKDTTRTFTGPANRQVVQASTDPTAIRESAAKQEPTLKATVQGAVSGVDGAEVVGSRVKDAESQANKADRDKPVETQKDHLGIRIAADSPHAAQAAEDAIAENHPVVGSEPLTNNGLDGKQVFVKTGKPGDANQVSEVQILPKEQVEALKETDPLYEQQKQALAAGDEAKAKALGEEITAIHKGEDVEEKDKPAKEGGRGQSPEPAEGAGKGPAVETKPLPIEKGSSVALPDGSTGTVRFYPWDKKGRARVTTTDGKQLPSVPLADLTPIPDLAQTGGKFIGVDMDKTLAQFDGNYKGPTVIGAPIPKMVDHVRSLLAEGKDVRIFTARTSDPATRVEATKAIQDWTEQHLGRRLPVTNVKSPLMEEMIDDRATGVVPNTGEIVGGENAQAAPPEAGSGVRQSEEAESGAAPAEQTPAAGPEPVSGTGEGVGTPGSVGRISLADLHVDPRRFQYKLNTDDTGSTAKLKGVGWNDELSGIITAWRDPADGKIYVVNGHHRFELAQRHGVPDLAVRMLSDQVKTAGEARVIGAMQNIAEGNGTAVDAAKFLRDTGRSIDDLKKYGVSPDGTLADGAAALARLDQKFFDDVVAGRLPERRGIAIGKAAETPEQQEALVKLISRAEAKGRTVTNATIEELGRMVKGAGEITTSQDSLFGTQTRTQNTALEKAEVSAYLRNQLSQEKKLFGGLSSTAKADKIGGVGENKIDAKENQKVATRAEQAQEIYDRLSTRTGPVNDILDHAAKRIAEGENANTVKSEAYRSIRTALSETLRGGHEEARASVPRDVARPEKEEVKPPPLVEKREAYKAAKKPTAADLAADLRAKGKDVKTGAELEEKPTRADLEDAGQKPMFSKGDLDSADRGRFMAVPASGADAPMVMVDHSVRATLNEIEPDLADAKTWAGVSMPKSATDKLVQRLRLAAADGHRGARVTAFFSRLADSIDAARDAKGNTILITPQASDAIPEEQMHAWGHRWDAELGDVVLQVGQHPAALKARKFLAKQGYSGDVTTAVLEGTAKTFNGDWAGAGLTRDEGASLLREFLDAVVKVRGPEALDDLPKFKAEIADVIEESRRQHGRQTEVPDRSRSQTPPKESTGPPEEAVRGERGESGAGLQEGLFSEAARGIDSGSAQQSLFQRDESEPLRVLIDKLKDQEGPKKSLLDRFKKESQRTIDSLKSGVDGATKGLAGIKGIAAAAWDSYRRPPAWTDFKDATGKFQAAEQFADHAMNEFADEIKRVVPDKSRREAMTNWVEAAGDTALLKERAAASEPKLRKGYELAQDLTPEEAKLAGHIREYLDAQLDQAVQMGLLEQGARNYITHIHEKDAKGLQSLINFGELAPNPAILKRRVFSSYFEGEQLGFMPRDKDIGYLTTAYHDAFTKALASRAYIGSMLEGKASDGRPLAILGARGKWVQLGPDDAPIITLQQKRPNSVSDYRAVDHPALRNWNWELTDEEAQMVSPKLFEDPDKALAIQGDLLLHPDIAGKVENILGKSAINANPVGHAALKVSSTLKQALLSFSGFHQTQEGVHALEHKILPANMPELDFSNKRQRDLVEHGLVVANFDGMSSFSEGVSGTELTRHIPIIGEKLHAYQNYLFRSYIPRLKMAMALHALERNNIRYANKLTGDQILELTANQSNAAFGGLNYKMMARNKTFQDLLRLTLLAPDFLEARSRFAAQATKPFGQEQRSALLRGALVLYATARILNYVLNDKDPKWEPAMAFSVAHNGHKIGLRTVQGDLLRLATDPRSFAFNRLNPMTTRPGIEFLTGRDQFGRQKALSSQAKDYLKAAVPIPAQGYMNNVDQNWAESLANALGLETGKYRSPAEEEAYKQHLGNIPDKPEDEDKIAESRASKQFEDKLRAGKMTSSELWDKVGEGKLTPDQAGRIWKDSQNAPIENYAKNLSIEQMIPVYQKANAAERDLLYPMLMEKRAELPNRPQKEREKLEAELDKLAQEDEKLHASR